MPRKCIKTRSDALRRLPGASRVLALCAAASLGLLAACGGGDDSNVTCSPSPSINSTPPTGAIVGQQYRYDVQFTLACIPFVTPCGLDLLQAAPGAGLSGRTVFWTPAAADAGTSPQFTIATKSDPCGNRATQSWSVFVT
jgi:hypothetical protein